MLWSFMVVKRLIGFGVEDNGQLNGKDNGMEYDMEDGSTRGFHRNPTYTHRKPRIQRYNSATCITYWDCSRVDNIRSEPLDPKP